MHRTTGDCKVTISARIWIEPTATASVETERNVFAMKQVMTTSSPFDWHQENFSVVLFSTCRFRYRCWRRQMSVDRKHDELVVKWRQKKNLSKSFIIESIGEQAKKSKYFCRLFACGQMSNDMRKESSAKGVHTFHVIFASHVNPQHNTRDDFIILSNCMSMPMFMKWINESRTLD